MNNLRQMGISLDVQGWLAFLGYQHFVNNALKFVLALF